MTDEQLEPAARRLCEIRGIDPEGAGELKYRCFEGDYGWYSEPRWMALLPELRAHLEREQALRETIWGQPIAVMD